MSYQVVLNIDGPRDPLYVLEVSEAAAEALRVLNHLTRDSASLCWPSEADRLIRDLETLARRLPQLLGQVSAWITAGQAAGQITAAAGEFRGRPDLACAAFGQRMDSAARLAGMLEAELKAAASLTDKMGSTREP